MAPCQFVPVRFTIHPPLRRADLPGLCRRMEATAAAPPGGPICLDLLAVAPDAVALDALARLMLIARRSGRPVTATLASAELRDLLAFTGLEGVLA